MVVVVREREGVNFCFVLDIRALRVESRQEVVRSRCVPEIGCREVEWQICVCYRVALRAKIEGLHFGGVVETRSVLFRSWNFGW